MKIQHISISRQSTFVECRAKYRFRYELGMVAEKEQPHFTYGKVVHRAIELHTLSRGTADIMKLGTDLMTGVLDLEPPEEITHPDGRKELIPGKKAGPLPHEYEFRLPGELKAYLKLCDKIGFDGEVEKGFDIDLDPPHRRMMTGYIDRIIRYGDEVFIIDYKTTKQGPWRETPETAKQNLQLMVYARVAQKWYNVPAKNIHTALFYLMGGNLVEATFSEDQLAAVEPDMLQKYKVIEQTDPNQVVGRVGRWCDYCDYKKVCPWRLNALKH